MLRVCPECDLQWDEEVEGECCPECFPPYKEGYSWDPGSYEDHFKGDR